MIIKFKLFLISIIIKFYSHIIKVKAVNMSSWKVDEMQGSFIHVKNLSKETSKFLR